jgi:hypothetical protein
MSNTPPPDPGAQPSPDPSGQPSSPGPSEQPAAASAADPAGPPAHHGQPPPAQPDQWGQPQPSQPQPDQWGQPQPSQPQPDQWGQPLPGQWGQPDQPQPGQPGQWGQPDPWGQPQPGQQQPGGWVAQPGAWGQQPPRQAYPPQYPPQYPSLSAVPGGTWFDPSDPLVSNDYAGWWRRGMAVVKASWKPLAVLQVLMYAPLVLLALVLRVGSEFETNGRFQVDGFGDNANVGLVIAVVGAALLGIVIALAWYAVGTLATVRMVVTVATGGQPRIGESLKSVLPRVPAMLGWGFVAGLVLIGAVLACLLPVFYVGAVVTILPAVVLFERGVGVGRCFQLFHADFGAAAGRAATILGLSIAGSVAFGIVGGLVSSIVQGVSGINGSLDVGSAGVLTGSTLGSLVDGVSYVVSGVVLTPLIVAMYADLRARREPFSSAYLVNPPV